MRSGRLASSRPSANRRVNDFRARLQTSVSCPVCGPKRERTRVRRARMAPVLLAVDADPAALGDVERELCDRYARSYSISCTPSPDEALEILERLSDAGEDVALVLAAQSLSGATGDHLLERVRQLHPHAKRGRLVPWRAWTHQPTPEEIFGAMALGRMDSYVLKPMAAP